MFLFTFLFSLLSWVGTPAECAPIDPASVYISTNKGESWDGFANGLPTDLMVRDVLEHDGTIYLTAIKDGPWQEEFGVTR